MRFKPGTEDNPNGARVVSDWAGRKTNTEKEIRRQAAGYIFKAHDLESSQEMFEMDGLFYDELPAFLRPILVSEIPTTTGG
jgi:hypothetical protein